jgi:hypothetical protein
MKPFGASFNNLESRLTFLFVSILRFYLLKCSSVTNLLSPFFVLFYFCKLILSGKKTIASNFANFIYNNSPWTSNSGKYVTLFLKSSTSHAYE